LGVAEAEPLKQDLRVLKCRNPIFLLENLFIHYRDTKTAKTLLAVKMFFTVMLGTLRVVKLKTKGQMMQTKDPTEELQN